MTPTEQRLEKKKQEYFKILKALGTKPRDNKFIAQHMHGTLKMQAVKLGILVKKEDGTLVQPKAPTEKTAEKLHKSCRHYYEAMSGGKSAPAPKKKVVLPDDVFVFEKDVEYKRNQRNVELRAPLHKMLLKLKISKTEPVFISITHAAPSTISNMAKKIIDEEIHKSSDKSLKEFAIVTATVKDENKKVLGIRIWRVA